MEVLINKHTVSRGLPTNGSGMSAFTTTPKLWLAVFMVRRKRQPDTHCSDRIYNSNKLLLTLFFLSTTARINFNYLWHTKLAAAAPATVHQPCLLAHGACKKAFRVEGLFDNNLLSACVRSQADSTSSTARPPIGQASM